MSRYGWLVFNAYLKNDKLLELNFFYQETAKKCGIDLQLVKNSDIFSIVENGKSIIKTRENLKEPSFILFLDKDINLARQLENFGYKVFNSPEVLRVCDDKILTHQIIAKKSEIKTPKTIMAPFIFNIAQETDKETDKFVDFLESELSYPLVVKETNGSFGEQVYLVKNRDELKKKKKEIGSKSHLYQEFVEHSFGRDARLYVVGGEFIVAMLRHSENDFRANVNIGGKIKKIVPSEAFIEMALEVSKVLDADFVGVDILFGKNGEPIFCEVNSNAHIKNITKLTGIDVGSCIFQHILSKI